MLVNYVLLLNLLWLAYGLPAATVSEQTDMADQAQTDKETKLSLEAYYKNLEESYMYGHCIMKPNTDHSVPNQIRGSVDFRQPLHGGPTEIKVNLEGFEITDELTKHGFNIHEYGDLSQGCSSAGPHFNPFGVVHGSPRDSPEYRHFGDLGNVKENGNGQVIASTKDYLVSLLGPFSILGRSVVVHAGEDDLGRGDNDESLKTGNAGPRLACCTVGLSDGSRWK
ncbi:hypothetical protein LSH36_209g02079 [Paralvinella palmiformis]|uniref:Superoxide dismutase [Cu-Zn] n=1 Tax=Paralvinella palmiformis TaxID=53620 RepID=A0AAD9JNZ8_9ANNE|nr:hypothetical protein LSH36_209g02079 [Paralvinella palmiformis]